MGNLASFYDPNREGYTIQADLLNIDYLRIARLTSELQQKLRSSSVYPEAWIQHLADSFSLYGAGVLNGPCGIQWNRQVVGDKMNLVVLITPHKVNPKNWCNHD